MTEKRLIVGLGNPGKEYTYTRHNMGFLVADHIAEMADAKFEMCSFTHGLLAEFKVEGREVLLLKPLTFVNESGNALRSGMHHLQISLENLLVICDDYHLNFGQLRIRPKGSDGGHNGLASVIASLGSENFPRLRIGIGQPKRSETMVDFVLGKLDKQEKGQLDGVIREAAECCHVWSMQGIQKAMDQFNKKNN